MTFIFREEESVRFFKIVKKFDRDSRNLCMIIKHGDGLLDIIIWLREIRYKLPSWITSYVAAYGHLNVVIWLKNNGYICDSWVLSAAAGGGHLELVKWLRQNDCPCDEWVLTNAACYGHLEVVKWLRQNGCPWKKHAIEEASGRYDNVVEYLREYECPEE